MTTTMARNLAGSAMLIAMIASGGCAPDAGLAPEAPRQISLAEFSSTDARPNVGIETGDAPARSNAADHIDSTPAPIRLGAGDPALRDIGVEADTPPTGRFDPMPTLVDSLIGQINGRPLFADDILLPIEDQLLAERARSTPQEYQQNAQEIVMARMQSVILNELFLSEARSTLNPQQQQGLLYFLRSLEEQEISRHGGSREQAAEQIEAEEGLSLDTKLEQERDTKIVENLFREKIMPRVVISWRDVEREYERRFDEFNPPATVTLARIRLNTEPQAELIQDVTRRLVAGENFVEVAESVGMPRRGLMTPFTLGPGGITDNDLNPEYTRHLEGLDEGDTSAPFTVRTRTMWLHVHSIDSSNGRSLYDPVVQRELADSLFQRRFMEERGKYMNDLLEKSSLDELSEMVERLMAFAMIRYPPS